MVRPIAFPARETVSAELTQQLMLARDVLAAEYISNNVIDSPQVESYKPQILPHGTMKIGEFGMADFTCRFETTEIDPAKLYVCYAGLHEHLKVVRVHDPEYHEDLLDIAGRAPKTLFKDKDIHVTEARLLGYFAAALAVNITLESVPAHHRMRERTKIFSASERKVKMVACNEALDERKQVLDHFALGIQNKIMGDIEPILVRTTQSMIARQEAP